MIRELQVIFGLHAVAVMLRVLRQLLVLIEHLRRIAARAAVDPVLVAAALLLAVACWRGERLPGPLRYGIVDLPMICVDPFAASAPLLVELAMDNLLGRVSFVTGAIG